MSVPAGFYELEPPPLVDGAGKPLSSATQHLAWDWPYFIRAIPITHQESFKYPNPNVLLRTWPGWRLYGGPMARWHYFEAKKFLEQWAFSRGMWLISEQVPILPNNAPTLWPRTWFKWDTIYEPQRPGRYRVEFAGLAGAKTIRVAGRRRYARVKSREAWRDVDCSELRARRAWT